MSLLSEQKKSKVKMRTLREQTGVSVLLTDLYLIHIHILEGHF